LAAGKGSRMESNTPKILLKINSKSLLDHSINFARKLKPKNVFIVISPKLKFLEKKIKNCKFIYQLRPMGTANAVKEFLKKKPKQKKLLVIYADTPFLNLSSAKKIINKLNYAELVLYSFKSRNNSGYGLIKRNLKKKIMKIIEFKHANKKDRQIRLCNSGMMGISKKNYKNIFKIRKKRISKEYYLTDIVKISYSKKYRIENVLEQNSKFLGGINTLKDYKFIKKIKRSETK